ncbi:MAG TPA: ABC transporter permease [Vicinamibacterales bacterium]|nr:ABC transporter permease [Vicinamibacterales bacterium]
MWLEPAIQDVRYALRGYLKAPAFSLAVVTTLALGIGASTAIFSMADGILLKPLPLEDPDRLVFVNETGPNGPGISVAWPTYLDWTVRAKTVSQLAVTREEPLTLTGVERPQRVSGRRVTANFPAVVGVHAAIGAGFSAGADRPGAPGEVMLGGGFWRSAFGSDARILGRTLVLDGLQYTVVGVLPAAFQYIRPYDVFVSFGPFSGTRQLLDRGNHVGLGAVGRLAPGATVDAADREFKAIAASLEREHPKTNAGVSTRVDRLADRIVTDIRPTLLALAGAVGCLLLVACVNVANLLIARGSARQHELAVRAAVGGSRARLAAQLLIESTLVSAVGGALGVAAAFALLRVLVVVAPKGTPRLDAVHLDLTALGFAFAAAATCGLVFGLFPAALAWRTDGRRSLLGLRGAGASAGSHRLRRLLVVIETALAIVLLTGAGLTMRTVAALARVDPGFQPDRLLTLRVNLTTEWTEARRRNFYADLEARVSALPGVTAVGLAYSLPIEGSGWNSVFVAADKPEPVRADTPSGAMSPVNDGYFDALRMRVVRGRVFDARDADSSPPVVVVNESLARRIWPGEDPVGKRLKQGWFDTPNKWREVVGVVNDVRFEGLTEQPAMQVYMPLRQEPSRSLAVIVRTAADAATVLQAVEQVVHGLDRDLAIYKVQTMDDLLDASIARQRMSVIIFITFAGVALVLAAVGLYGVVAQGVTERTHEIGIRLALGARRGHVLALIVGQGLAMALAGTVAGLAGAAGLSRTIQGLLFGVKATDPATFAAVPIALLAVAALACWLPARRAARLDPTKALRAE